MQVRNPSPTCAHFYDREKTGGKKEEDPTEYISKTTKRGPLPENWLEETQQKDKDNWGDVMCSYKLVKVEFKYWGIQRKMENWILDLALRKTILKVSHLCCQF